MKVRVLEVDQWSSTGNITDFTMDDFDPAKLRGGDSEVIRTLGLAHARVLEVDERSTPPKAYVWYRAGGNGKLEFWKANYDSSD